MIGLSKTFRNKIVTGLYAQDISEFQKRYIIPFTIAHSGNVGFTPIIGYELEYSKDKYKIFTILTPILATVGIGVSF